MIPGEDRVRTFVAVDIGIAARGVLEESQQQLRRAMGRSEVRWARPDQLHLTLAFLGNVNAPRIPDLIESLGKALRQGTVCRLELSRPGAFPSLQTPRVLWVGLAGEIARLSEVQALVARAAGPFGEHREARAFQPHLTIGRVARWNPSSMPALEAVWSPTLVLPASTWNVGEVRLMRSVLGREGATHSELARFPLA